MASEPLLEEDDTFSYDFDSASSPFLRRKSRQAFATLGRYLNLSNAGEVHSQVELTADPRMIDTRTPGPESARPIVSKLNPFAGSSGNKLSTFYGVFVPTWLSISGILVFLRLGYCIGHAGVLHTLLMFTLGFGIALMTTLSVCAMSTNGIVREGGVYYLISRCLGVEFGGIIGLIMCFGNILQNSMNVFGFVEPLMADFSQTSGNIARSLPDTSGWHFLYGSIVLFMCVAVCFFGANMFARTSTVLFIILVVSSLSILVSFLAKQPFDIPNKVSFTGWRVETFNQNLYPNYTTSHSGKSVESFQSIFSILYPSCTGILAGAALSGDLESPGRAIPKGTLWAIAVTFVTYIFYTIAIGFTISRDSLLRTFTVLNEVGLSSWFVQVGIYTTALFSIIGGSITAAKTFQAMAKDDILPMFRFLKGSERIMNDEPIVAVLLIWFVSQLLLFVGDINSIAPFVTILTLQSYGIINFACFMLKAAGAPNFRPRFKYFNWSTALLGAFSSFYCMFYVSPLNAALGTVFILFLWVLIHFTATPKSWGDIQQALIYHQVRKYLLRLDIRKEHVKYWRPQILLLVYDPKIPLQLVQFANCMKKGALYIIGEVVLADKADLSEYSRIRNGWMEQIDHLGVKAFVEVAMVPDFNTGTRTLLTNSGLGAMKPNILLLPWLTRDGISLGCSKRNFISMISDCVKLGKSVVIARGFDKLEAPPMPPLNWFGIGRKTSTSKTFIDLYPFFLSRNSDSFTMILQLGCILHMVPQWSDYNCILRVIRVVERNAEIDEESARLMELLDELRIKAKIVCVSLESLGFTHNITPTTPRKLPIIKESVGSLGSFLLTSSSHVHNRISNPTSPDESPSLIRDDFESFELLSSIEQCRMINQIMRIYSHPHQTSVAITSLPAPPLDESDESQYSYYEDINALSSSAGEFSTRNNLVTGLPPTMLIHGQGVVVTTNL